MDFRRRAQSFSLLGLIACLCALAVFLPSWAVAWDEGFNFRDSSGYCTDGADQVYVLGETSPTTRGGVTFQWSACSDCRRDRNNARCPKLAGVSQATNNGSGQLTFTVTLPSAGDYIVRVAMGDEGDQGYQYFKILDDSTVLTTCADTNGTTGGQFTDATCTTRTSASDWATNNATFEGTWSTTTFKIVIGSPDSRSGSSTLSHLQIVSDDAPTPTPTATPTATPTPTPYPVIPGAGIDTSLQLGGTTSGTKGSCPAGYADAIIGLGCGLLFPSGTDRDNDGYTGTDCNDTRKDVYPGVYVPDSWASPTGYKLCQAGGTYGSTVLNATTPLCEATGEADCYYIQCDTGNDSTGNGSYSTPWKTIGKVAGGSSGSPPASPQTLAAGDFVYILGGTCSTAYSDGTTDVLGQFNSDGTTGARITIKNYPGSTATLSNANGFGLVINGDYYNLHNLDIATARTDAANATTVFVQGDAVTLSRSHLQAAGHGDNNDACFYCTHTNTCKSDHNFLENCVRATGNVENISAIKWLDDEDTAGEGYGHSSTFDTIWWDTYSNTANGSCWMTKHGVDFLDTQSNGLTVSNGICLQPRRGFLWVGAGMRATDNFVFCGTTANSGSALHQAFKFWDDSSGPNEDNRLTYSTFVNCSLGAWNFPTYDSASEKVTFQYNVFVDNDDSYSAGDNEAIVQIDPYGSDAQKSTLESQGSLAFNYNCYYNAAATLTFNYFREPGTSGGHGPAGAAGGAYTFAEWKSTVGQDANSVVTNPTFDSYWRATASSCVPFGWRRLGGFVGMTRSANIFNPVNFGN